MWVLYWVLWRLRYVVTIGRYPIPETPPDHDGLITRLTTERNGHEANLTTTRTTIKEKQKQIDASTTIVLNEATDPDTKREHLGKIRTWRIELAMARKTEERIAANLHAASLDLGEVQMDKLSPERRTDPEMRKVSARSRLRTSDKADTISEGQLRDEEILEALDVSDQEIIYDDLEADLRREAEEAAARKAAKAEESVEELDPLPEPEPNARPKLRTIQGDLARVLLDRAATEEGKPIAEGYEEIDDDEDEPPQVAEAVKA